jgi:hypothetical protein
MMVVGFSASAYAQVLLNFQFSFISNPTYTTPGANGVVTGELVGLTNNATSLPKDVIIDSARMPFLIASPVDLNSTGAGSTTGFTVPDGVITGGAIGLNNGTYQVDLNYEFNSLILFPIGGGGGFDRASLSTNDGFDGATYTDISAPEPSTWAMLVGGLVVLGVYHRPRA